jgi:hypothetical protein
LNDLKVHHKVEFWRVSHNFINFLSEIKKLRKVRKLSICKNFNLDFAAPFNTILVKMVAYNLHLKKIDVNFEGLKVHFLNFLRKKKRWHSF